MSTEQQVYIQRLTDWFSDSVDTSWGDPVHALACKKCGALVQWEMANLHVEWHESQGPVKAFQDHWKNGVKV